MKKVVLIIDDEEILIKTLTHLLTRQGYQVYPASKGEDALHIAETESFDLVICDMRMPGLNGVETMRQMRILKPSIPVIFITGFVDEKLEEEAGGLRPLAYLHKPFDVQEMLGVLKNALL